MQSQHGVIGQDTILPYFNLIKIYINSLTYYSKYVILSSKIISYLGFYKK